MLSHEVTKALLLGQPTSRIPVHLYISPWAREFYPEVCRRIEKICSTDIASCHLKGYRSITKLSTNLYEDRWGCRYTQLGYPQGALIQDLKDWVKVNPPYEELKIFDKKGYDSIQRQHEENNLFLLSACEVHPWERYQLIRGNQQAFTDLIHQSKEFHGLLEKIHNFYRTELEAWANSDVDALVLKDDWGSAKQLTVNPEMWRQIFLPLYREYAQIACAHDKFIFFHSDGYVLPILKDLIELGVHAINVQLTSMPVEEVLKKIDGKAVFWGIYDLAEIIASYRSTDAVEFLKTLLSKLADYSVPFIARLAFDYGSNPETVRELAENLCKNNDPGRI